MREEEAARKRGDSKIGFGVSGVSPKPSPKPSPMASPSTSPRRKISAARSGQPSEEKKHQQLVGNIQKKPSQIGKGLKSQNSTATLDIPEPSTGG